MPVYQCVTKPDTLTDLQRLELAEAITKVHVGVTNAPAFFVNVVFIELLQQRVFTAGRPSSVSFINGVIRSGRSAAEKEQILTQLSAVWCRITGSQAHEVIIGLSDIDPTSAMEAGLLFPAPGHEATWIEENGEALAALSSLYSDGR